MSGNSGTVFPLLAAVCGVVRGGVQHDFLILFAFHRAGIGFLLGTLFDDSLGWAVASIRDDGDFQWSGVQFAIESPDVELILNVVDIGNERYPVTFVVGQYDRRGLPSGTR